MDPVQRKIHEVTLGLGRAATAHDGTRMPSPASGQKAAGTRANLAQVIARRLQTLDANDPSRRSTVVRLFLETVLTAELGESFAASPQFTTVVDRVQRQMEQDTELAPMLDQAVDALLAMRGG